jgi:hypothetical protein
MGRDHALNSIDEKHIETFSAVWEQMIYGSYVLFGKFIREKQAHF